MFKLIWSIIGIVILIGIFIFLINSLKEIVRNIFKKFIRHKHKFEHLIILDKKGNPISLIHKCKCGLTTEEIKIEIK